MTNINENYAALHYDGIEQANTIDESATATETIEVTKIKTDNQDDNMDDEFNRGYLYKDIPDFYKRVGRLLNNSEIDPLVADYFEYAPSAEFTIKKLIPDWKTILKNYGKVENVAENTEKYFNFLTCIIIQTAINMYSTVIGKEYKMIQTVSSKIEYNDSDVNLLTSLKERLNQLLSSIITEYGIGDETFMTLS